jgi:hypothetical protein
MFGKAVAAAFVGSLVLLGSRAASAATENQRALHALAANREIALCAHEVHKTPLSYAGLLSSQGVVLPGGTSVVVFEGGCESGNDNDALYIYAAHDSQPYELVAHPYGFLEKLASDGTLVLMTNPGGVNVRYHQTQRWNGVTFAPVSSEMVWVHTGESKPAVVPLAFAAGSSSATVSGTVREDFPDVYRFDARPGQKLSVEVRARTGGIGRMAIGVQDGATITSGSTLSWRGTLPVATHAVTLGDDRAQDEPGGHYLITIDGANERRATYDMTVSIK